MQIYEALSVAMMTNQREESGNGHLRGSPASLTEESQTEYEFMRSQSKKLKCRLVQLAGTIVQLLNIQR
jgi:hypothetical protein